jgi:hypothetical protein
VSPGPVTPGAVAAGARGSDQAASAAKIAAIAPSTSS